MSREPTHWNQAIFLGSRPSLDRRLDVARRRPGGREHPFEFHRGDDIRQLGVLVIVKLSGVKRGEARRKDQGADLDPVKGFLLVEVHGPHGADLLAGAAFALFNKVDALIPVDGVFQRHRLGVFHIGALRLESPTL